MDVAQTPLPDVVYLSGVDQLLARALELLPPDSHDAGRLLPRYAFLLRQKRGDFDGAREALGRALTIAQREQDAALEARTLAQTADVDASHLNFHDGRKRQLRAIALARQADDPRTELSTRIKLAVALILRGEVHEARPHLAEALPLAGRVRERIMSATALEVNADVRRMEGDWHGARQFSDRALAMAPRSPVQLASRALLEYEVGEFGHGSAYVERLLETMRLAPPGPHFESRVPVALIPVVARITGVAEHFDVAEAAANTALSVPSFQNPQMAALVPVGLGLMAVQKGDVATAADQYAALEQLRGTLAFGGIVSMDRVLGLLAQSVGNLEDAAAHFEDALVLCRKARFRPELAWASYDYAALLHARREPSRALALLGDALAIANELGMHPLTERAESLRGEIELRIGVGTAATYTDGLTPREIEVLSLIACGKSNRQIAKELVLSVRTVERHITNIYGKIGAGGRADATAYAIRHHLTDNI